MFNGVDTKKEKASYKKTAWFRLLNVVFFCLILLTFLYAFTVLWINKPEQVIDYASITCINGKVYNSNNIKLVLWSENIDSLYDGKIRFLCLDDNYKVKIHNKISGETGEISKGKIEEAKKLYNLTEEKIQSILTDTSKIPKNYSLTFKYKTVGDWITAISYAFLVLVIGLVTLEIIKRTLRYIFMGISFFE